jgi:hypothetical protein
MVAVKEISWEEASAPDFEHTSRQAFRAAVDQVALRAKATLPECNGRVDKAVQIVLAGDVELLADGHAQVASQCQGTTTYHLTNGRCECKDYPHAPSGWCKHRLAAGIQRRATQLVKGQLALPEPAQESVPAPSAQGIAPEHITFLHGKPFVRYAGVLALAHQRGLTSIKARFTLVTAELALAEAEVVFADGTTYSECADSTPGNVPQHIRPHFPRMALTRCKARALRDALNIGMTALEELAGE